MQNYKDHSFASLVYINTIRDENLGKDYHLVYSPLKKCSCEFGDEGNSNT